MNDYPDFVWLHDRDGAEYACPAHVLKGNLKTRQELTKQQREKCIDLSQAVDPFWG